MPHQQATWTEVEFYKGGRFFRRFWINQDTPGYPTLFHLGRYSGDIHCVVTHVAGHGAYYHEYDSAKGRMCMYVSPLSGLGYTVQIEGHQWYLLDGNRARSPLTDHEAIWDGSQWRIRDRHATT